MTPCSSRCSSAADSVETKSSARTPTAPVRPVNPAGTARGATARARLVHMGTAARRRVHAAGTTSHATPKLDNVGGVTLDGQDPGEQRWCFRHT